MLSACSVLGACFAVAKCHKRPRLTTSFYGIWTGTTDHFTPLRACAARSNEALMEQKKIKEELGAQNN